MPCTSIIQLGCFAYISKQPFCTTLSPVAVLCLPVPAVPGHAAGTDADLRRLGHKRAGDLLMTKFGMSAEEVNALARWDRIDVIRRCSNVATHLGGVPYGC